MSEKSSPYKVLARKYRPESFAELRGQDTMVRILKNAFAADRIAHSFILTGIRGTGKTTTARIIAKGLNCIGVDGTGQPTTDPCGKCENCIAIIEGRHVDVIEMDAASQTGVGDIREIIDSVHYSTTSARYKIYIIDEVHMLSLSAFNAFLKTLEEPPKHAIFILATTEKNKIIPTILSRCQIYDFKRISVNKIKEFLIKICELKNINFEEDALILIAQKADGAMRDALSIFDRMVSFTSGNLLTDNVSINLNVLDYESFFLLSDLIKENQIPNILIEFNDIISKGYDTLHFINGLANHIRMLVLCKDSSTTELLEVGDKTKKKYIDQSQKFNLDWLIDALKIIKEAEVNHKFSINKRLNTELCLMQLASLHFNGEKKKV